MQMMRVAQSCHLGNQVKYVLGPHMITNQQYNVIGSNVSRFCMGHIGSSTGLSEMILN